MIRRLEPADLQAAVEVSAAAFGVDLASEADRSRWQDRVAHSLRTDPDGAFVAEREGRVIGVAQTLARERLWCLALLTVSPDVQSMGAGRALLAAALSYRAELPAGLVVSSNDPRAMRLYGLAGFSLQPTFAALGTVDRGAMPRPAARVLDGDAGDLEALEPISRVIRGGPHTLELEFALRQGGRLLRCADRGFTVVVPGQGVWVLVARDDEAARVLLWSALDAVGETREDRSPVRWITGRQDWAVEVVLRAGLQLRADGALAIRGNPGPLRPFIPSGPFG